MEKITVYHVLGNPHKYRIGIGIGIRRKILYLKK